MSVWTSEASRLVLVQAEVEEVAEKASALRDAEGVRAVEGLRAGIPVGGGSAPEPRGGVAHREEAQAHERRVRRAVHELVDLPRLEAVLDREAGGGGGSPRAALPLDGRGLPALAHGEASAGGLGGGGRVRGVVAGGA